MPRTSTDIGIVFPRRGTLTDLLQDDADNIADRLGGRAEIRHRIDKFSLTP